MGSRPKAPDNSAQIRAAEEQSAELKRQQEEARMAKEALAQKDSAEKQLLRAKEESAKFDNSVEQIQKSIQTIKANIGNWENELKTLKARVKVSNATKNLNKQMAELDSTGTVSMLERMKEKVAQEEALAEAYGDIAKASKSIDDEIDKAADTSTAKADSDLAKLKEQLGLKNSKNS